jgi:hypothetical protein
MPDNGSRKLTNRGNQSNSSTRRGTKRASLSDAVGQVQTIIRMALAEDQRLDAVRRWPTELCSPSVARQQALDRGLSAILMEG